MVVIFSTIAGVIDASEKAEEFVKAGVSAYYILTKYYAGFIPFIISMIFPLDGFYCGYPVYFKNGRPLRDCGNPGGWSKV